MGVGGVTATRDTAQTTSKDNNAKNVMVDIRTDLTYDPPVWGVVSTSLVSSLAD